MTKQTYLNELNTYLKANNVEDIDEIVAEYDEHFTRKMADGYTEEEIAARLLKPKEIAQQFAAAGSKTEKKKSNKVLVGIGLFFSDLFVIPFTIVMYAWMAVLGLTAIATAVYGIGLIVRPLLPENILIIPPMPYAGGAIWGVMMIAFGLLAAFASIYFGALTMQMWRAYRRWHKNMFSGGKYPPYSMHPVLKDHLRRKLRSVTMIALVALGAAFVIGFIVMAVSANALGFWHTWNWFA
jgi:uncharacterized membrane protein